MTHNVAADQRMIFENGLVEHPNQFFKEARCRRRCVRRGPAHRAGPRPRRVVGCMRSAVLAVPGPGRPRCPRRRPRTGPSMAPRATASSARATRTTTGDCARANSNRRAHTRREATDPQRRNGRRPARATGPGWAAGERHTAGRRAGRRSGGDRWPCCGAPWWRRGSDTLTRLRHTPIHPPARSRRCRCDRWRRLAALRHPARPQRRPRRARSS